MKILLLNEHKKNVKYQNFTSSTFQKPQSLNNNNDKNDLYTNSKKNQTTFSSLSFGGFMPLFLKEQRLRNAIKQGDTKTVKTILEDKKININKQDKNTGDTYIQIAIRKKHNKIVRMLLDHTDTNGKKDINIELANEWGNRAIHDAAATGNIEALNWLINANVNINPPNKQGNRPLHLAVRNVQLRAVKILVSSKNINLRAENINKMWAIDMEPEYDIRGNSFIDVVKFYEIISLLQKKLGYYTGHTRIISRPLPPNYWKDLWEGSERWKDFAQKKKIWEQINEQCFQSEENNFSEPPRERTGRINLDEQFGYNPILAQDPVNKIRGFYNYSISDGKTLERAISNINSCNAAEKLIIKRIHTLLFKNDSKEFRKLMREIHPDTHPDIADAGQLTAFLSNFYHLYKK